jgi:hypothetical protein
MSLIDFMRQEYLKGIVVDKYRLDNGHIGLVIDDDLTQKLYHVEFRDGYNGPCLENLFGLAKEPFAGKAQYLEKLVNKGNYIEATTSYSKDPFRQAYRLHAVSASRPYRGYRAYAHVQQPRFLRYRT